VTDKPDETTEAFRQIYSGHAWGGVSRSGEGSSQEAAREYVGCVEAIMAKFQVTTVLDLGCGDWEFSRQVDWGSAHYTGIDIVPDLVASLRARFGGPRVDFLEGNFLDVDLPSADLVLCKDVLQHLTNAQVQLALDRLSSYPLALLTNDRVFYRRLGWRSLWKKEKIGVPNEDIAPGGWRPLILRDPPFNLKAQEILRYTVRSSDKVWVKEVLLVKNTT
jgi:SAM-dependent methyltransferase